MGILPPSPAIGPHRLQNKAQRRTDPGDHPILWHTGKSCRHPRRRRVTHQGGWRRGARGVHAGSSWLALAACRVWGRSLPQCRGKSVTYGVKYVDMYRYHIHGCITCKCNVAGHGVKEMNGQRRAKRDEMKSICIQPGAASPYHRTDETRHAAYTYVHMWWYAASCRLASGHVLSAILATQRGTHCRDSGLGRDLLSC